MSLPLTEKAQVARDRTVTTAYRGRRKPLTEDQVNQLRQRAGVGDAKTMLAREFGISRETVYHYLRPAP